MLTPGRNRMLLKISSFTKEMELLYLQNKTDITKAYIYYPNELQAIFWIFNILLQFNKPQIYLTHLLSMEARLKKIKKLVNDSSDRNKSRIMKQYFS